MLCQLIPSLFCPIDPECHLQTKPLAEGHMNIQMERRRLTILKTIKIVFAHLERTLAGNQISREELLNVVQTNPEVRRFFDRLGFMQ